MKIKCLICFENWSKILLRQYRNYQYIYLYILTLAVAVVGNCEFVTALLASSLFESTQAFITLAVRSADWSTTTRCFTLWTAHAPRSSSTYHAFFSFFAPYFCATLCRIKTIRNCACLHITNVQDNAVVII